MRVRLILVPLIIGAVLGWVFMEDYLKKSDMGDPQVFFDRAKTAGVGLAVFAALLLVNALWLDQAFVLTLALLGAGVCVMSLGYMAMVHWRRKG